jgi:curved DNA binding protein
LNGVETLEKVIA